MCARDCRSWICRRLRGGVSEFEGLKKLTVEMFNGCFGTSRSLETLRQFRGSKELRDFKGIQVGQET